MRSLLCTLNAKYIHSNLAIRILYEQNRGQDLDWKEFTIKEDRDEIAAHCAAYDLIAFSCYIWNITQTLEVCRLIKAINPQTRILLGGPEVSYDAEELILNEDLDMIIKGEGETPFKELLHHFPDLSVVPSLVYKQDGQVISNATAPQFDVKLFENSMPYAFDDIESLRNKVLYIETSRGCPYKCEFCLASLDNKVRYLPDSCIKRTLLFLMEHGRVIKFLDRTFNIKKDFTLDIFRFILANRKPENVFQFEITADILHPDIIRFIHEEVPAGVFRFEIGIQSVNREANLSVSRKQSFEKTKNIILELDYKIEMHLDLIIGLPLDRWDDVKYSFEEVFKLYAPEMQLGFLKFLKGTTMRNKPEHEYEFHASPPYEIKKSKYLSAGEIADLKCLENALEIYWNGKKAINTLHYIGSNYSAFEFLLGLGKLFEESIGRKQYSLTDMFDVLWQYANDFDSGDKILRELIAADYYLHFRVRPGVRYIEEADQELKKKTVAGIPVTETNCRYIVIATSFDLSAFMRTRIISKGKHLAVFAYDGKNKARLIGQNERETVTI